VISARGRSVIVLPPPAKKKRRWITNDQAKRLAKLRRRQGKRYDGYGMTYQQASQAIREATDALRAQPSISRKMSRAQYAELQQAKLRAAFRARQERAM
jgi:hypothetical protein